MVLLSSPILLLVTELQNSSDVGKSLSLGA